MRRSIYGFLIVMVIGTLVGCVQKKAPVDENVRPMSYEESYLESFLDSVGRLPIEPMVRKARKFSDSIYYNGQKMSVQLTPADRQMLLQGKMIPEKLAQKYHWDYDTSMVFEGKLYLVVLPFDKDIKNPEKFAFYLGIEGNIAGSECDLYFVDKNTCIAKHHVYHRYGLELDYYVDTEGKTVVYYKENFTSGTGIWWFDFYFYRYDNGALKPILSELQNGNLSMIPSYHGRWLESSVISTKPLTLKMVYYLTGENGEDIINDSTEVKYKWDAASQTLRGDYKHSKLSREQVLSYNLGSPNDLFFIRAHYNTFKQLLKDRGKRKLVLYYLNDVKAALDYNE